MTKQKLPQDTEIPPAVKRGIAAINDAGGTVTEDAIRIAVSADKGEIAFEDAVNLLIEKYRAE